jgi:hypothetical protein
MRDRLSQRREFGTATGVPGMTLRAPGTLAGTGATEADLKSNMSNRARSPAG